MLTVREDGSGGAEGVVSTAEPTEESGQVQEDQGPDKITVHYSGQGTLDKVSISASTARLMLLILNSMPLQGGGLKIQVGVAQQELEEALKLLEANNPRIKSYPIRPATRAEKRRAQRSQPV